MLSEASPPTHSLPVRFSCNMDVFPINVVRGSNRCSSPTLSSSP